MTQPAFKISLAQWSLHRAFKSGALDVLAFAGVANRLGFDAIEYVNQCFADKAQDRAFLAELKRRAVGEGVWSLLMMVDHEGRLGDPNAAARAQAVENHKKWVAAAAFLGCHAVRVNARSEGNFDEQLSYAADGLVALCTFADDFGINIVVENHGGLSSNGAWLAQLMKHADHPRLGTLPDFGNFAISDTETYDRYQGVADMAPFAKAVSAKSFAFDAEGNETSIDFARMMNIVLGAGYRGYVGIEYEGQGLPEEEGILATKRLLERVRTTLQAP